MHSLFLVYLLLAPIYILPNGMPQIADIVLSIGSTYYLFSLKSVNRLGLMLLGLFVLSVIVNLSVTLISDSPDNKHPLLASLFLLPNLIAVLAFQDRLPSGYVRKIAIVFSSVLLYQIIVIFLNSGFVRATGTFNNPNQLASYVVTVFALILIGNSRSEIKVNSKLLFLIFLLSSLIIVYTASRIAMIAIPMWVISRWRFTEIKNYVFLGLVFYIGWIALQTDSLIALTRLADIGGGDVGFVEERGLDRLYLYPECLIFGCGEGYFTRFKLGYHNLEIHSLFGSVFFSYGLIGIGLVVRYFTSLSWRMAWREFIVFLPVVLFNLVHNGSRKSYLWLSLLVIAFYLSGRVTNQYEISKCNHHRL